MVYSMLIDYFPLILTIIFGFGFGVLFMYLSEFLGAKRSTKGKSTTYESGMVPYGTARDRFSVKFYMVAVSFIIFDIEVVFLYPFAVQFKQMGLPGIIAMSIFIFVLLLGYFYEKRKGGFEWD